jgi:hypothetical protein
MFSAISIMLFLVIFILTFQFERPLFAIDHDHSHQAPEPADFLLGFLLHLSQQFDGLVNGFLSLRKPVQPFVDIHFNWPLLDALTLRLPLLAGDQDHRHAA